MVETAHLNIAPCKRIQNPESSKFLLLESGIQRLESGIHNGLESGIHRFGMESGIQKVGIRNPKGWNPESICWDPESRTFVDSLTWGDKYDSQISVKTRIVQKNHLVSLCEDLREDLREDMAEHLMVLKNILE